MTLTAVSKKKTYYRCPYPNCNFKTTTISALTRHVRSHENGVCPFCGEKYKRLVSHLQEKAKAGCEKHAALWYCLIRRVGSKWELIQKYRDVAIDYLTVKEEEEAVQHETRSNEEVLYRCPLPDCDYTTSVLWSLIQHVRTHHGGDRCPACGKECKSLANHFRANAKDIVHACLYFLFTNSKGRRSSNTIKEVQEKVMEYLTVRAVKVSVFHL